MVAVVVAKKVIARTAELVAAETVVMLIAVDPDLVLELAHRPVVLQALPLAAGVDHARLNGLLDHLASPTARRRVIVEVQGLHDQCIGPRPSEAER